MFGRSSLGSLKYSLRWEGVEYTFKTKPALDFAISFTTAADSLTEKKLGVWMKVMQNFFTIRGSEIPDISKNSVILQIGGEINELFTIETQIWNKFIVVFNEVFSLEHLWGFFVSVPDFQDGPFVDAIKTIYAEFTDELKAIWIEIKDEAKKYRETIVSEIEKANRQAIDAGEHRIQVVGLADDLVKLLQNMVGNSTDLVNRLLENSSNEEIGIPELKNIQLKIVEQIGILSDNLQKNSFKDAEENFKSIGILQAELAAQASNHQIINKKAIDEFYTFMVEYAGALEQKKLGDTSIVLSLDDLLKNRGSIRGMIEGLKGLWKSVVPINTKTFDTLDNIFKGSGAMEEEIPSFASVKIEHEETVRVLKEKLAGEESKTKELSQTLDRAKDEYTTITSAFNQLDLDKRKEKETSTQQAEDNLRLYNALEKKTAELDSQIRVQTIELNQKEEELLTLKQNIETLVQKTAPIVGYKPNSQALNDLVKELPVYFKQKVESLLKIISELREGNEYMVQRGEVLATARNEAEAGQKKIMTQKETMEKDLNNIIEDQKKLLSEVEKKVRDQIETIKALEKAMGDEKSVLSKALADERSLKQILEESLKKLEIEYAEKVDGMRRREEELIKTQKATALELEKALKNLTMLSENKQKQESIILENNRSIVMLKNEQEKTKKELETAITGRGSLQKSFDDLVKKENELLLSNEASKQQIMSLTQEKETSLTKINLITYDLEKANETIERNKAATQKANVSIKEKRDLAETALKNEIQEKNLKIETITNDMNTLKMTYESQIQKARNDAHRDADTLKKATKSYSDLDTRKNQLNEKYLVLQADHRNLMDAMQNLKTRELEMQTNLKAAAAKNDELTALVIQNTLEVEKKSSLITQLEIHLKQGENMIESLRKKIDRYKQMIALKEIAIKDLQIALKNLGAELETVRTQRVQLLEENQRYIETNEAYRQQVIQMNNEYSELQRRYVENERKISSLESQNAYITSMNTELRTLFDATNAKVLEYKKTNTSLEALENSVASQFEIAKNMLVINYPESLGNFDGWESLGTISKSEKISAVIDLLGNEFTRLRGEAENQKTVFVNAENRIMNTKNQLIEFEAAKMQKSIELDQAATKEIKLQEKKFISQNEVNKLIDDVIAMENDSKRVETIADEYTKQRLSLSGVDLLNAFISTLTKKTLSYLPGRFNEEGDDITVHNRNANIEEEVAERAFQEEETVVSGNHPIYRLETAF